MLSHYGLAVNLAVALVLTLHQFTLTGSGHLLTESCQAAVLRTLTGCAATRTLPLFDNHITHAPLAQELEKHVMNELWAHPTLCSSTLPCEFSSHPHPVYWCSILLPGLCFSHNSEIQKILKGKLESSGIDSIGTKDDLLLTWTFICSPETETFWSICLQASLYVSCIFMWSEKSLIPKPKWAQKFLKGELWICISESITNGKKNICN